MVLTDIAIRKMQYGGKAGDDKHADGQGMYLRGKSSGKYGRMNYRFEGKHKTMALGVYPEVSLAWSLIRWTTLAGQRSLPKDWRLLNGIAE